MSQITYATLSHQGSLCATLGHSVPLRITFVTLSYVGPLCATVMPKGQPRGGFSEGCSGIKLLQLNTSTHLTVSFACRRHVHLTCILLL